MSAIAAHNATAPSSAAATFGKTIKAVVGEAFVVPFHIGTESAVSLWGYDSAAMTLIGGGYTGDPAVAPKHPSGTVFWTFKAVKAGSSKMSFNFQPLLLAPLNILVEYEIVIAAKK